MEFFVLLSLTLGLGMVSAILNHGYKHVRQGLAIRPGRPRTVNKIDPDNNPEVAVVIPVTGNDPGLMNCLESFLEQDLPRYRTFLVTSDLEDKAVPIIREIIKRHGHVKHLTAGHAVRCSQKNLNLLAGIKAAGETPDILVFCDSSHTAPSTLLSDLIRPIVEENEIITSGFHRVVPEDAGIFTVGLMLSVLTIHLLQGNRMFNRPWGGATAIRRTAFFENGIDRLWERTVVDDYTMGPYLLKKGIRCRAVSTACMMTHLSSVKMNAWVDWLTRQLLYMKFCTPGEWAAASIAVYLFTAPILLAILCCVGFIFGLFSPYLALSGAAYIFILTGIALWSHRVFSENVPAINWMISFYLLHYVAFWCYVKTWFTGTISWRNISYRTAFGGEVIEVFPTDKS